MVESIALEGVMFLSNEIPGWTEWGEVVISSPSSAESPVDATRNIPGLRNMLFKCVSCPSICATTSTTFEFLFAVTPTTLSSGGTMGFHIEMVSGVWSYSHSRGGSSGRPRYLMPLITLHDINSSILHHIDERCENLRSCGRCLAFTLIPEGIGVADPINRGLSLTCLPTHRVARIAAHVVWNGVVVHRHRKASVRRETVNLISFSI